MNGHFVSTLLLIYIASSSCGDGQGKEPQPKIPPLPKEEKHEIKKDIKQTLNVCYQGYTLRNDKKCVREISMPPFQPGNVVKAPYVQRCPPGYDEKKHSCFISVEVAPEFYCPAGWIDNVDGCVTTESPEYVIECPKGKKWEFVDNKCSFIHKAKAITSSKCPDGSHIDTDGHCWKIVGTYDCTPEKDKKEDKKDKEGRDKKKLRRLGEKKDEGGKKGEKKREEKKVKVELLTEMDQVSAPRTTKVGITSQMCEKKVKVEPIVIISCPDDFTYGEDGECWKEEVVTPIRVCASKEKKGECPEKQRFAPKVAKCPIGSEREKDTCIKTTVVSPVNICPPNWTDSGEGCIGTLDDVPQLECLPGLKLVDGRCIGEVARPAMSLSIVVPADDCESKT